MSGRILVLGATGNVGRPLVRALLTKGESVRAASRSGRSEDGAEGARFDLGDRATIGPALEGVDRVFIMAPTGTADVHGVLSPVVAAAAAASVKIVFLSAMGVEADDATPFRQIEIAIETSGVPFVTLRPNWFSDNFHTFWKPGIDHGVIAVPAGEGRTSFIDARDIAACAAVALTSPAFDGMAYTLTGPEAWSYADTARMISEVIGRTVHYQAVDDEIFIGMLAGAGVPGDYARMLASIFHPVREGWTATVTDDVKSLTGTEPLSLGDYLSDHALLLGGAR